jgi:hypothetical protein
LLGFLVIPTSLVRPHPTISQDGVQGNRVRYIGIIECERRVALAEREVLAGVAPASAWAEAAVAAVTEDFRRLDASLRELVQVEATYNAVLEADGVRQGRILRASNALGDPVAVDALPGLSGVAAAWGGAGTVEGIVAGIVQRLAGLYRDATIAAADEARRRIADALA